MAHKIEFNEQTQTHSFVSSSGEKAWHGLGQVLEGKLTAAEAIEKANLGYEVIKTSLHAKSEGDVFPAFEKSFATLRTDNNAPLGIVGESYEVVQNKDAFGFFDAIIDAEEAIFETAGVLGKGERIFVTAKLPEDYLVGGEACNKYIILTNSHDGKSSVIAGFTSIRIVCNNTLQAALKNLENRVYIQHKIGAQDRLKEAYRVMNIASKYMNQVSEVFNEMTKVKVSDDVLLKYIEDVMRAEKSLEPQKFSTNLKNKVNEIFNFCKTHPTQTTEAANGTLWGAYNSISGYYNYNKKYKNAEVKFKSQLFGLAETKISKAFRLATNIMEN